MSILSEILEHKRGEVARARREVPLGVLEEQARAAGELRSLARALRRARGEPVRVIAEFKRASPSAGPIRADAEPESIARDYERGGASAISVLTDRRFFAGELAFLARVRRVTSLPLLRKDFLIDPYQVVEARAGGADSVLLIVAALDQAVLGELMVAAREHGLDALVEVHSEAEAERAVSAGASLIGVNHRDLATFEIDMGLTGRLSAMVPAETVLVAESGIRGPEDLRRMAESGAHAVLVGETLMRAPSPGEAVTHLLEGA